MGNVYFAFYVSNRVLILTKLPILSSLRMEWNLGRSNLHVGGDILSPAKKSLGNPLRQALTIVEYTNRVENKYMSGTRSVVWADSEKFSKIFVFTDVYAK